MLLGDGLRAAAALVLPTRCGGCGLPGERWCAACRAETRRPAPLVAGGPVPRGPACWSGTVLDGAVRRAVTAHKDDGRRDLRDELAGLLATAVARALAEDPGLRAAHRGGGGVLLVPVPPSPAATRRRGDDPVGALAALACRQLRDDRVALVRALRHTRAVADQARLGRADRAVNLAGALETRAGARSRVAGAACLVLDDVVTTGATLAEAARALRRAGAGRVAGATVAATPRGVTRPGGV